MLTHFCFNWQYICPVETAIVLHIYGNFQEYLNLMKYKWNVLRFCNTDIILRIFLKMFNASIDKCMVVTCTFSLHLFYYLKANLAKWMLYICICNRVELRWKVDDDMTVWLGSSVVECSHGQQKTLGSSPSQATIFHLLQTSPNIKSHCGEVV